LTTFGERLIGSLTEVKEMEIARSDQAVVLKIAHLFSDTNNETDDILTADGMVGVLLSFGGVPDEVIDAFRNIRDNRVRGVDALNSALSSLYSWADSRGIRVI